MLQFDIESWWVQLALDVNSTSLNIGRQLQIETKNSRTILEKNFASKSTARDPVWGAPVESSVFGCREDDSLKLLTQPMVLRCKIIAV